MKNMIVESFSGIRGKYGDGITEELAKKYAISYCREFNPSILVVGCDSRPSSLSLKKAIIDSLNAEVIDVGVLPVQAVELAITSFKADGGFYITASHNELEDNGWKMLKKDGAILYKEQSDKIIDEVNDFIGEIKDIEKEVTDKSKEAKDLYISYVIDKLDNTREMKKREFKVLADPNGGSAIIILKDLFERLNIKAEIINNKLGEFNRKIEPNKESLTYLRERAKDFDLSFGFDSDSDRVEFITSEGEMITGQYVLALASDSLLKGTKGQVVVVNDATSYLVRDVIKKHNAVIREVEVGETNVVTEMEKQNSIVGGEGSNGGVIIPPIKCRDGILTAMLILKMMVYSDLKEIIESYPKYYSDRTKVECSKENASLIKDKIEEHFKDYEIRKTETGLKIMEDDNSFFWFRQSQTEPGVFRIHSEGDSEQKVKDMLQKGIKAFKKYE